MAKLIRLNEVLPQDLEVEIEVAGKLQRFVLPGDLTTVQIFGLIELFQEALKAEEVEDTAAQIVAMRDAAAKLDTYLLDLFKERQPDMERLPFGRVGSRALVAEILTNFGFSMLGPDTPDDEPDPTPGKPKPKRSPRSTGSSRSAKSTASRSAKS